MLGYKMALEGHRRKQPMGLSGDRSSLMTENSNRVAPYECRCFVYRNTRGARLVQIREGQVVHANNVSCQDWQPLPLHVFL